MRPILVLDATAKPFEVVVVEGQADITAGMVHNTPTENQDLATHVKNTLRISDRRLQDLQTVVVNIGPGALSSVRSGVSFANALAYSLKIPVCPILAFDLMAAEARIDDHTPVLCSSRASHGNAYVSLYKGGQPIFMRFGPADKVIRSAVADQPVLIVAGHHRPLVTGMNGSARVIDSGIERSHAAMVLKLSFDIIMNGSRFPDVAQPITEESEAFHD